MGQQIFLENIMLYYVWTLITVGFLFLKFKVTTCLKKVRLFAVSVLCLFFVFFSVFCFVFCLFFCEVFYFICLYNITLSFMFCFKLVSFKACGNSFCLFYVTVFVFWNGKWLISCTKTKQKYPLITTRMLYFVT